MTQLDMELQALAEKITDRKQLELRQKELQKQLLELESKARDLRLALRKEEADVESLERLSLTAFVQWITGRHEEALDREKSEARAAGLKYQAACLEKQDCEAALQKVAVHLRDLDQYKAQYADLLAQKQAALKAQGHPAADRILELENRIAALQPDLREIREAAAAGREALHLAGSILQDLDKAADAAGLDVLGGGLVTDIYKYRQLDKAQDDIQQLQRALRRFNTELRQTRSPVWVDLPDRDGMLRFADFFYDGLLVDLVSRNRITGSRREVEAVQSQVRSALSVLDQNRRTVEQQQNRLRAEISKLVLEAKPTT